MEAHSEALNGLPPKPTEPSESECCGTGCSPCVFDIYKKQLKKWEEECERIRRNGSTKNVFESPSHLRSLNPETYENFRLVDIIPDTDFSNIYRFNCNPAAIDAPGTSDSFPVHIGHHVLIKIESISRQYTVLRLLTNDAGDRCFDILIKIYPKGSLTPLIAKLNINDLVSMRGPFAKAIVLKPNAFKNIVLLAAGTGIAPYYRIIENVLSNEDDYTRLLLLYSNKSVKNIMLKSDLKRWSSFWNFRVVHYLTRNGTEPVPYGMEVRKQRLVFTDLKDMCEPLEQCFYFICGTRSFEKDMVNYLNRMHVNEKSYHVF